MNKTNISLRKIDKSIHLIDLTDNHNGSSAYNKKTRSFKKAYQYILENSLELKKKSMYEVMTILDTNFDMGMRSYCAMD